MKDWKRMDEEFNRFLLDAGIYDYRYPVKGCGVWLPYGFKIRENMLKIIRRLLNETGHQEVLFPLLIPERNLRKEAEHIKAFEGEVYWVTHGGKTPLKEKLALRPTSETAIYPMFSLWIRSHRDLPLKIYQVVNIFRYETKATRPIIRVREVMTFKEAHTAHASREDAEKQVKEAVNIYSRFFDELCLPYLVVKRPRWDKFPGAEYSIAFDTVLPDGRRLQIGTVHYLGQNFARVFDIKFLKPDGTHDYVYQTCYGISGRPLVAVMLIHGDERGLVLPPSIAPIHVVIIPIVYKDVDRKTIEEYCEKVKGLLVKEGFKVELDLGEETPGSKFYYWEYKGVPFRVEVGIREVNTNTVTLVRRDELKRKQVKLEELPALLRAEWNAMLKALRDKAWKWFEEKFKPAKTIKEARKHIEEGYVAVVSWCGKQECGLKLSEEVEGEVLGVPVKEFNKFKLNPPNDKCVVCGSQVLQVLCVAKSY